MAELFETLDGLVRASFAPPQRWAAVDELMRLEPAVEAEEPGRVLVAVLTLAGGDLGQLRAAVEAANADRRVAGQLLE